MTQTHPFVENFKLNKMLNSHLYEVRNKKIKPNTKGAYSYCYFFGDYVILKNRDKIDMVERGEYLEEDFEKQKQFFNELKQRGGVNIPETCCCYKGKHHFYRIEERAKGNVLSVFYPSTARALTFKTNKVLDNNNTAAEIEQEEKIQASEASEIGYGMFLYNNNMQKQLKNADQKHFDKFVRDFKILIENHVGIDTSRSENFLFDKNAGFSFVDLEMDNSLTSVPDDFVIAQRIFSAFADFKTYLQYMNSNQQRIILLNHDAVLNRVLQAIKNNKFNLSPEQYKCLSVLCNRGKEEYAKLVKMGKMIKN